MSDPWSEDHSVIAVRGIIQVVLANRPAIYSMPDLSLVNGNGGNRINQKLQQLLRLLPNGDTILKEEIAKSPKKKGNNKSETPTPKKVKREVKDKEGEGGGKGEMSPKKRKVKEEKHSEDEFWADSS